MSSKLNQPDTCTTVRSVPIKRSVVAIAIIILLATLLATATVTALTVNTGNRARNWFTATGTNTASNVVAVQQEEKIESELITVSRFGFMPLTIKRPAKDFVMTIVNRSSDPELNLTLNRVVGNRPTDKVIDVKLKKGRGSWNAHFNLPPGDYELTEINNPQWKCTITLTPR